MTCRILYVSPVRILAYAACVLLLLSCVIAAGLGIPLVESWRQAQEIQLQAALRHKALSIELWLRHAEVVVWQIANRADLRDTLVKLQSPLPTTEEELADRQLLGFSLYKSLNSALEQDTEIIGITLVDNSGLSIMQRGVIIPDSLWPAVSFSTARQGSRISEYFFTFKQVRIMPPQVFDGEECLLFAVSVYSADGDPLATLVIARRMAFLRQTLLERHSSPNDEVLLGMQNTRGFSVLNAAQNPTIQPVEGFPADMLEAIDAAHTGKQGLLSRGASIIAYVPVGSAGWTITLRTPIARLYAPASRQFFRLVPWILAVNAALLVGIWLVLRKCAHQPEAE